MLKVEMTDREGREISHKLAMRRWKTVAGSMPHDGSILLYDSFYDQVKTFASPLASPHEENSKLARSDDHCSIICHQKDGAKGSKKCQHE